LKSSHLICRTALPLLFLYLADPAAAQEPVAAAPAAAPIAADGEQRRVNFTSDQLVYDTESEVVTVSGNVEMTSEGNNLRADRVIWNRNTGEVRAEGNVRVVNPQGDAAYGDSIVLTDTLRDGVIDNLLLVLEDGGRLAADRAERREGFTTLYRACLLALRGGRCARLPQGPDLEDHGGAGGARPGPQPDPVSRRQPQPVRGADHRFAGLSHPDGRRAAAPACSCRTSASAGRTALSSASLIISSWRRTATRRSRRTSIPTCCRCWRAAIAS
jgi:hypothetical protein